MNDPAELRAWCERKGEKYVRFALENGKAQGPRASFARYWLDEMERSRTESSQAESLEIARSAKDAAWAAAEAARDAADAAREANTIAKTARLIAIVAVIASGGIPIIAALLG